MTTLPFSLPHPGPDDDGTRVVSDTGCTLSALQQGMLLSTLLHPGAGLEVQQFVFRLREPLDAVRLAACWQAATDRHEVLRTSFRWEGLESPEQVVWSGVRVPFAAAAWGGDEAFAAWLAADRAAGFAMDRPPLQRVAAFRRTADDWTLVWTFHHALLDGRGLMLVLGDVFGAYDAAPGSAPAPAAHRPFREYLHWFHARDWSADEGFWRGVLSGFAEATPLPAGASAAGGPGPEPYVQRSAVLPFAPLDGAGRAHGLTPNALVQAAWGIVLARHGGSGDVVFGTTRACRRSAAGGARDVVGQVINTVPARLTLAPDTTLLQAAEAMRGLWTAMRPHEHTPLQRIQEWAGTPGRLFHTIAVYENVPMTEALRGLGGEWAAREVQVLRKPAVPLTLSAYGGAELRLTLTFDPARFSEDAIARLLGHLRAVLLAFVADPGQPALGVELLSGEEEAALAAWGQGAPGAAPDTVHAAFARAAASSPHAVALESGAGRVTYAELDARANRLARHLRGLGVAAGTPVGIFLERGPELVVAALATLKAGGAYVPLDPAYPAERLAFMLADTAVPVLVTDSRLAARLPAHSARLVAVDTDASAIAAESAEAVESGADAESAAYVMYTSGSTGRPKGIEVPHRAIVRLVRETDFITITPDDVFLQLAPASFDAATLEIWGPLLNGARLAIHPPEQPGVDSIAAAIHAHGVTILWLTAGLFHLLVDERIDALRGVRQLLAGGDVLSVPHVRRVLAELPETVLINGYGPTENTTFTCCHRVDALVDGAASVPIGRPIAGTRVRVLDGALRPVPIGVPGELYAGGAGLALGYLHRPELTAEMFVADPFTPGARLYRTGDRVRWLADGTLEFLGRVDTQVKIRGFRIEPGEVEAALLADPRVRAAAVVVRDDAPGGRGLVAYVVGDVDAEEVRASVRARLPEYMLPAAVVRMDALPLTPNGKTDRRALPAPAAAPAERGADGETPTEGVLAALWAQVLGVPRVGVDDNLFALGAHSLSATRVAARVRALLGAELPLRDVFDAPTVRQLAARVDAARGAADPAPPLVPVPRSGPLPLSFAQERLWVLDQVEPDRAAYVVPTALRLRGALHAAALERALGEIVRRHEALRTVFRQADTGPVAVAVVVEAGAVLAREELGHLSPGERKAAVRRRAAGEAERPFDLAAGPLYRFALVRLADDDHALLLTFHHAVTDGWSVGVLLRELAALYAAFLGGRTSPLAPLAVQYADFAAWQRAWLRDGVLARELAYWTERLAGAPELLELPTDRPRPAMRSGRGARVRATLPAGVAAGVEALARREGATPYMVLLAAYQALLARYTGQDDVVVGSPVAGRSRPEVQELAGVFVNTLALRAELSDDPTFAALLARTREATLGAFAHQDLPFEKLVEALRPERSASHSPVFQAMLALQSADDEVPRFQGLDAEVLPRELATAKFDLFLALRREAGGLGATLEYATDLWDEPGAARMLQHFGALLAAAVADPSQPVSALPMLGAAERARVMEAFNDTHRDYPAGDCIHDLFQAQVRATPHALALWHEGRTVTYAALNARANRVARRLRGLGVGPETPVGVRLRRTPELVAALLGVLKAGGAYLPLDPAYPAERIRYMLQDSGARVLLTERALADGLPADAVHVVALDADPETDGQDGADLPAASTPANLAYLIYTSGSTGRPKGVQIEHRRTVTFLRWLREAFPAEHRRSVLGSTSVCFDVSIAELFGTLCWGGRLVLVENALSLASLPAGVDVQTVVMVPSAAAELVRMGGIPACVRVVDLAGEPLPPALASDLYALPHVEQVVNLYGPTEDTTYSTRHVVERGAARVMIGGPAANARMWVLDARLRPVPVGVPGELYMAGDKLARGYHARPGLTAERFIPDPHGPPGSRMYRGMDLARWRGNGALEYLGRTDFQLKVRGFRVEPGEIESVLREHPAVAEAAVVAADDADGSKRLAAYVVASGGVDEEALRAHLRARLPEYMVPSAIAFLPELPRTPNGKTDRRALPAPAWGAADAAAYVEPRTPTEEAVAGAFAAVLSISGVGAHGDFFALGGHSLLATRVVVRMRDGYGVELPMRAVFEAPTVAALAARIDADPGAAERIAEVMELMRMLSGVSDEQAAALMAAASPVEGVA